MPNLREIPVDFVVERAKTRQTIDEAMPLRTLISDWFTYNQCETEGYADLSDIDSHFRKATCVPIGGEEPKMKVVLPGCVLSKYRTDVMLANKLVDIIREIHRCMTIPLAVSNMAKRPEDVRKTSWTWPHVMRVMKRRNIIIDGTTKANFGRLIETVLGDKVKPNSIRRANYGDYSVVDTYDYDLKEVDKDILREITALFVPLFKPIEMMQLTES